MKRTGALLLLVGCALALAEPQLTLESDGPRLGPPHGPHSGTLTLPGWGPEFYIEEIEVPDDTKFSMTYLLPPGGDRSFIQPPHLPHLKDLAPFTPFAPNDHDGSAPRER